MSEANSKYYPAVSAAGTYIPAHGNRDIGTGLLRAILRDIDVSVGDFNHKMKR